MLASFPLNGLVSSTAASFACHADKGGLSSFAVLRSKRSASWRALYNYLRWCRESCTRIASDNQIDATVSTIRAVVEHVVNASTIPLTVDTVFNSFVKLPPSMFRRLSSREPATKATAGSRDTGVTDRV